MERPIVRIVEPQEVKEEIREVTGSEAEDLLRKYGYSSQTTTRIEPEPDQNNLTFEEAIRLHEEKEKALKARTGPKPITFESDGYDQQTKYVSDDGIGFTIQISTDMKLPNY